MRIKHTNDSARIAFFAARLTGWHSYAKDKRTARAIERAVLLGAIEVNEFHQLRPARAIAAIARADRIQRAKNEAENQERQIP